MDALVPRFRIVATLSICLALVVAACSDSGNEERYVGPTGPEVQAAVLPGSPAFDQELGAALAAQAVFTDELMARPGVVGTAVGLGPAGRPGVLVLVESPSVAVPASVGGVGAYPLVTGTIYARQETPRGKNNNNGKKPGDGGGGEPTDPTARFARPVPIGVSTGHPDITAGTIGARVVDGGGNVYALSNNHVYAHSNAASVDDPVIQPGTYDGGLSPADDIGALSDFVPITFSTSASNVVDAAIASTTTSLLGNATFSGGYGTPQSATVPASINLSVQKCGRTTACTNGSVAAINATVSVNYGTAGVARFVNQIIIQPGSFSAGGDSGSLIVVRGRGRDKADDGKPVGLLFAGSTFYTIANPIDAVLEAFGVSIDGS